MNMTIKKRDVILLSIILAALLVMAYYYLYLSPFLEERDKYETEQIAIENEISALRIKLAEARNAEAELNSLPKLEDYDVLRYLDEADLFYYVASVTDRYSDAGATISVAAVPTDTGELTAVAVAVSGVNVKLSEFLNMLSAFNKLPFANRITSASIGDPQDDARMNVSLTFELLCLDYTAPPDRTYPFTLTTGSDKYPLPER